MMLERLAEDAFVIERYAAREDDPAHVVLLRCGIVHVHHEFEVIGGDVAQANLDAAAYATRLHADMLEFDREAARA